MKIKGISFDPVHRELMHLLDCIDKKNDPSLATERFNIIESYGHKVQFLNGPTHVAASKDKRD